MGMELRSCCPLAPVSLFPQDSEVQKGVGALRSALGLGQLSALGWLPGPGHIHEGPGSVRGWGSWPREFPGGSQVPGPL